MIPLTRPFFGKEEAEAVAEVLAGGWVAQGPATRDLETDLAVTVGARHAIATSSCTTALHLAVVATGIGPGDEVILPSFTFPATANAVLYEGATPVLVDVRPDLNVDPAAVAAAVGPRTKAVIGVHLFGWPCAVDELRSICAEHGLVFIEDAACAIGTAVDGRAAGSFGDVACFSFHGRKVLTCGEGGALTTSDDDLARRLRSLRTHGADEGAAAREASSSVPRPARYVALGYNYRLSDVQAAIARVQLRRLSSFLDERREIAARYEEGLRDLEGLRLPPRDAGRIHSYQSYVVTLEKQAPREPDALREALASAGVATQIGTYAVHRQPYLPESCRPRTPLPVTEEAAERAIAIPMFNGLTRDDQARVIEAIRTAWSG